MKVSKFIRMDETFFFAHLECTGTQDILIVEGEIVHPALPFDLIAARWSNSGEDGMLFLMKNVDKVTEAIIAHL